MSLDDMAQLAQYTGSLACQGEFVRQNMSFGFLIDEEYFRVGFSPFALEDGLLLPVVLFTPPICWRNGTMPDQGACVALCLLQRLVMRRVVVLQDQLTACLTQDACENIVAEARQISSEPHVEEDDGVLHYYLQEVEQLRLEVGVLRAKLSELRDSYNPPPFMSPPRPKRPRC